MSRKKIAFQGMLGAYSHLACIENVNTHLPYPCTSFDEMIAAVQNETADLAMVPVENSTAGRVADIHHLLPDSGLFIISEHFLPIKHRLLGIKGTKLSDIREVHSHEQGLAQCKKKISSLKLKAVIHPDTAGAALDVSKKGDKHIGAIASDLAGEIYELNTILDNITDEKNNTTRFLVMSKKNNLEYDKKISYITTIIFEVRSVPAVLYKALGGFATNSINLTKIESYMLNKNMNSARFYIDCEGHPNSNDMRLALEELSFYCKSNGVRILGTYPASKIRKKLA